MSEKTLVNKNGHRHEESDANIRGVTISGIIMAASVLISLLIVYWTIHGFQRVYPEAPPETFTNATQAPPEPRLQYNPEADLRQMRAAEDAVLETYGWVDRGKGVARIPIGRAMELMAAKGLPARGTAPVTTEPPTGAASGGPQTGPPVVKTPRPNPPPPQGVQH